jgi:hypothetical protein
MLHEGDRFRGKCHPANEMVNVQLITSVTFCQELLINLKNSKEALQESFVNWA